VGKQNKEKGPIMNTASRFQWPPATRQPHRWPRSGVLAAAILLAAQASPLAAQDSDTLPLRLWAAQTGLNQISLAWDSVPETAEYRIYLGDPDVPGTFAQRPVSTLSAGARGGILTGIQRESKGLT